MTKHATLRYVNTAIYYTADVYTPDKPCDLPPSADGVTPLDITDCTCTNSYGEYTKHGYGETESSGWIDHSWSSTEVHENREDVRPDYPFGTTFDPDVDAIVEAIIGDVLEKHYALTGERVKQWEGYSKTREEYIEDSIERAIGCIDHDSGDSYYAADPLTDYYTGERAMYAAHVYNPEDE